MQTSQEFWFVQGDAGEWHAAQDWQIRIFQMRNNVQAMQGMDYGANVAKHGQFVYAFYWKEARDGPMLINLNTGRRRKVAMYTIPMTSKSTIDVKEANRVRGLLAANGTRIPIV